MNKQENEAGSSRKLSRSRDLIATKKKKDSLRSPSWGRNGWPLAQKQGGKGRITEGGKKGRSNKGEGGGDKSE